MPVDEPLATECVATIASYPANWRYARRYIMRSASESSCCDVPGCGMHVPPPHARLNDATEIAVGPVNVVLAVFAKSAWNFQTLRTFVPKLSTTSSRAASAAA